MRKRGTYEGTPRSLAKASPTTKRIWGNGREAVACERERQIDAAVAEHRRLVRA